MALTIDEVLELQAKVLASRTDTATNPNMKYSTIASRNTGLNPEYFSGNDTKIVNALNKLYKKIDTIQESSDKVSGKFNEVIFDTESNINDWKKLQELMESDNLVTGLTDLYENKLSGSSGDSDSNYATNEDIDSIINNLK